MGRRAWMGAWTCVVVLAMALPAAVRADVGIGTWTAGATMPVGLSGGSAAPLSDGRVLVVGTEENTSGFPAPPATTSELYDPRTGSWSPASATTGFFIAASPAALPDDRALVVGGAGYDTSAAIFDGKTNTWYPAAPMPKAPGYQDVAAPLPGGRVLVVGGTGYAEIYSAATNSWSWAASMGTGTALFGGMPAATDLPDGRVLVTFDDFGQPGPKPQIYDPATNSWSVVPGTGEWSIGEAKSLGDGHCSSSVTPATRTPPPSTTRLRMGGPPRHRCRTAESGRSSSPCRTDGFLLPVAIRPATHRSARLRKSSHHRQRIQPTSPATILRSMVPQLSGRYCPRPGALALSGISGCAARSRAPTMDPRAAQLPVRSGIEFQRPTSVQPCG